MCDVKIYKLMFIYFIHDIKDFLKSRHDYVFNILRVEKQTHKVVNELIKYFYFNPKSRKGKVIDLLLELQEELIDIRNDEISRYKLYRFNRAYTHILGYKATCGEIIDPIIISCCYNVFNAIYTNRNILIDFDYLGYSELGDLLKMERSKSYQIIRKTK